jgi:hypothetical protein
VQPSQYEVAANGLFKLSSESDEAIPDGMEQKLLLEWEPNS